MIAAWCLYWILAAFFVLACAAAVLPCLFALPALRRLEQGRMLAALPQIHAGLEPPVSVVLTARDDAPGVDAPRIAAAVHALLALHYPLFEILVVDDGSSDDTMQVLTDAFALHPFPEAYRVRLPLRQPVTRIYRSTRHPNLRVIGKQAGGRADALNAAVNAARYPLVFSLACGTVPYIDSLHDLVLPFLANTGTVASVGLLDTTSDGARGVATPGIDALRAERFAPLGWSALDAMLVAPPGIQLLRKDAVVAAGGYCPAAACADADMLLRLHHAACDAAGPYRIAFTGEAAGHGGKDDERSPKRRCMRRQQVLVDGLARHMALLWGRRVPPKTRLAFLLLLVFDGAGPAIETAAWALLAVAALTGLLPLSACAAFLVLAVGLGMLQSTFALLLDAISPRGASRPGRLHALLRAAVTENLGPRQVRTYWRTLGLAAWLRQRGQM